jgi:DNA-binding NarL/FixJ family response regulator
MSISISNLASASSFTAANYSANVEAAQQVQKTTDDSAAVVKLSESQQVVQLHRQGQLASQIASNLSLTVDVVNSYLGISSAK